MRAVSFVYAYYDNPAMLERQYAVWAAYPRALKRRVEICLVDDASPRAPALDVPRPDGLPDISIFRVRVDVPWHQDGARNLGAHVAERNWLFLSDMDHVLPAESLARLFRLKDEELFYTFGRFDAATGCPTVDGHGNLKAHPNSYLMTKAMYWRAGGYDEDFSGFYGTDGMFRRRLERVGRHEHLPHAPLMRFTRAMIADASCTTLARKTPDRLAQRRAILDRKAALGRLHHIATLEFEWDQVL